MRKKLLSLLLALALLLSLLPAALAEDGEIVIVDEPEPIALVGNESGTLRLASAPAGADVYIDGELYRPAVTPCEVPLSAGEHSLSLRMAGYDDYNAAVSAGDTVDVRLTATIPSGPNVRTIVVDADCYGTYDGRLTLWNYYERFVLNGEPEPELDWEEDQTPLYAYWAFSDGVSLAEALGIVMNDSGWYDEEAGIRWHYVIEFAEGRDVYLCSGLTCYGRGTGPWVAGGELFTRYTYEGPVEDLEAKAAWSHDGCFTVNGDRDRDGTPDVTLEGIESYGWDGTQSLALACTDAHVVGLRFSPTMHVAASVPFWQPKLYFYMSEIYITGCVFESIGNAGRFFGAGGGGSIYGSSAEGYGLPGTSDVDGFYISGCEFQNEQLGIICAGGDMDYARAKNLVIQGNRLLNGEIFVRNEDAHTWYMWYGSNPEMSGTMYGEDCIGTPDYNILENVTISGNTVAYTAEAVPDTPYDSGYGSAINIGNSNLGGSHNTMRNVLVRCNRTTLEQANIDAFQYWGNAGFGVSNADVGDEKYANYPAELASQLTQVSDNLIDGLLVEYNDFQLNCFDLKNIGFVGTAQIGVDNDFRNVRIEHNRIATVRGLHIYGASGTSNLGTVSSGAFENLVIADNEISVLRKTGWGPDSEINSSGEQDDYGILLIGADVCDYDASDWDEYGEREPWDTVAVSVSGVRIERNAVRGFANGVQVAAARCSRTHYVTDIAVNDVTIADNEIVTDGVNKNCRNNGVMLVAAIDGGVGCLIHRVSVERNRVTAANGLFAAGYELAGMRARFGVRDNQVLHVTARDNVFSCVDPTGNGGFPIVTADAVARWDPIPFALGESAVVLAEENDSAAGFAYTSMKLAALSRREVSDEAAFLAEAQAASDGATAAGYIAWAKDSEAEACETPLFTGVCDTPNYRPGSVHRFYLSPCGEAPKKENEVAPGCETEGGYDLVVTCSHCGEEIGRDHVTVPATGHTYGEPVWTWAEDYSAASAAFRCACGDTQTVNAAVTVERTEPTHDEDGKVVYTATAEFEGKTWTDVKTVVLPKLPPEPTDPVLSLDGMSTRGVRLSWTPMEDVLYYIGREDEGGSFIKLCDEPFYLDPDVEMGKTYRYRVNYYANRTWAARTEWIEVQFNPFADVSGKKTIEYVAWAYNNDIVKGTSETSFTPNAPCTRVQFVMMLWKMHGSPEVEGVNPFSDVSGAKTTKAVLWALDAGVIVRADAFRPNDNISRAEIVMILWKLAGSPEVAGENPFTDVSGKKTAKAVLWAYQQGITKGTGDTTFAPGADCTRVQLVVFLYKYNLIYRAI